MQALVVQAPAGQADAQQRPADPRRGDAMAADTVGAAVAGVAALPVGLRLHALRAQADVAAGRVAVRCSTRSSRGRSRTRWCRDSPSRRRWSLPALHEPEPSRRRPPSPGSDSPSRWRTSTPSRRTPCTQVNAEASQAPVLPHPVGEPSAGQLRAAADLGAPCVATQAPLAQSALAAQVLPVALRQLAPPSRRTRWRRRRSWRRSRWCRTWRTPSRRRGIPDRRPS